MASPWLHASAVGLGPPSRPVAAQSRVPKLCAALSPAPAPPGSQCGQYPGVRREQPSLRPCGPRTVSSQGPALGRGGSGGLGAPWGPRLPGLRTWPPPPRHVCLSTRRQEAARLALSFCEFWRAVVAGNIWTWSKEHNEKRERAEEAGLGEVWKNHLISLCRDDCDYARRTSQAPRIQTLRLTSGGNYEARDDL